MKCWLVNAIYLAFGDLFSHVCHAIAFRQIFEVEKKPQQKNEYSFPKYNNPFHWNAVAETKITDMWLKIGRPMKRLFCFVVDIMSDGLSIRKGLKWLEIEWFPSYRKVDRLKKIDSLNHIRWKNYSFFSLHFYHLS